MIKHKIINIITLIFVPIMFLSVACKKIFCDTHIKGYVYNETTGNPMPDVRVGFYSHNIFRHSIIDNTNNKGKYSIDFTFDNSDNDLDTIYVKLLPYNEIISEGTNSQQIESHSFLCLDSLNYKTSYYITESGKYNIDFYVTPEAKLSMQIFVDTSLDLDSLLLLFPNSLCCIEKYKISKQQIIDNGDDKMIFGTKFTTLGDMDFVFNYKGYKNGAVTLENNINIFTEKFETITYVYKIE